MDRNFIEQINSQVEFVIHEKLALVNFSAYLKRVGEAYLARPTMESQYAGSWGALIGHCKKIFKQIESKVDVEFVDDDPYTDADQMVKDVKANGVLKIWTGASDKHPLWNAEENWIFRAVHDWYSHILGAGAGGHKFDARGELNSYNRHIKIAPQAARVALFTEIVGQISAYNVTGSFNYPQKVCKIWGVDYVNIGLIDENEFKRNFEK